MVVDFVAQRGWHSTGGEVVHAGAAGDCEAGRDGHAQVRHLRQVGALRAEHALHVARAIGATVPEEVDESRSWHALIGWSACCYKLASVARHMPLPIRGLAPQPDSDKLHSNSVPG